MAPKQRAMKRPAAQATSGSLPLEYSAKRAKRALADASGSTPSDKLKSVLAALRGQPGEAQELPAHVDRVLAAVARRKFPEDTVNGTHLQPFEEEAVKMVGVALDGIEARLVAELRKAQAKVTKVEADREAKASSFTEIERADVGLSILEAKKGLKRTAQDIQMVRQELQKAKAVEKKRAEEVKQVAVKVKQLEGIEKDAYQPLKQAVAKGSTCKQRLQQLRKVGKEFGFHDVLLNNTMPKVLLKSLDRRQTFDNKVLELADAEFAKKRAELDTAMKSQESARLVSGSAVQTALEMLTDFQKEHDCHARMLKEAEVSSSARRKSLGTMRRAMRDTESDMKTVTRDLTQAGKCLESFRNGPLAAFKDLEDTVFASARRPSTCCSSPLIGAVAAQPNSPPAAPSSTVAEPSLPRPSVSAQTSSRSDCTALKMEQGQMHIDDDEHAEHEVEKEAEKNDEKETQEEGTETQVEEHDHEKTNREDVDRWNEEEQARRGCDDRSSCCALPTPLSPPTVFGPP